jgi:ABC-type uncharacterized transport system substrate-binding protein
MNIDAIFAMSSTEVEAARQVTNTIPIVFATHADPIGVGHAASLAQPGGNATGLTIVLTDLVAKQLDILKEALPQATRSVCSLVPRRPRTVLPCRRLRLPAKSSGFSSNWYRCEPLRISMRHSRPWRRKVSTVVSSWWRRSLRAPG